MSEDRIKHKECFRKLESVKRVDNWLTAVKRLGFRIANGGKHPYTVRDPQNPNDDDYRSLVTTIPSGIHRGINKVIAKQILFSPITNRLGITEEQFWKIVDSFRSPHLWKNENGNWQLLHQVK